jgi:ribosomal protein L37AE/L43A
MNKISEIFQAWVAAANPTPDQLTIAQHRSHICDGCEHKTHVKAINSFICGKCGCPLSRKVFSPVEGSKACPLAKWEL